MYATIPVYYPSLEEAARKDEAALWCDSYKVRSKPIERKLGTEVYRTDSR